MAILSRCFGGGSKSTEMRPMYAKAPLGSDEDEEELNLPLDSS